MRTVHRLFPLSIMLIPAAGCGQPSSAPPATGPAPVHSWQTGDPSPTGTITIGDVTIGPTPPRPPADAPPAETVSAELLAQANVAQIAAWGVAPESDAAKQFTSRFSNKRIAVSGTVLSPQPGTAPAWKSKIVLVGAPRENATTRCNVVCNPTDANARTFELLDPGVVVRVVGTVHQHTQESVDLVDCTVEKLGSWHKGPPSLKPQPAIELTQSFVCNPKIAAYVYLSPRHDDPALLYVTGEVAEVTPGAKPDEPTLVRFAGAEGWSVVAAVRSSMVKNIRKGMKARASGLYDGYDEKAKTVRLANALATF